MPVGIFQFREFCFPRFPIALLMLLAFGAGNALIDRLAACETFFHAMPVRNGRLAHLPAQQDDATIYHAGKIQQTNIEVFHLHAGGADLGEGIFDALLRLVTLGLATRPLRQIGLHPTQREDAVAELVKFAIDGFHLFFRLHGSAQQALQNREQLLRLRESESAVSHEGSQ